MSAGSERSYDEFLLNVQVDSAAKLHWELIPPPMRAISYSTVRRPSILGIVRKASVEAAETGEMAFPLVIRRESRRCGMRTFCK
jgi:hypothetical protein